MKTVDTCEWCNCRYPKTSEGLSTMPFYEIELFGEEYHEICGDCYEHLKEVL